MLPSLGSQFQLLRRQAADTKCGNKTVRETERPEVQIKTLSRDGEIRMLPEA